MDIRRRGKQGQRYRGKHQRTPPAELICGCGRHFARGNSAAMWRGPSYGCSDDDTEGVSLEIGAIKWAAATEAIGPRTPRGESLACCQGAEGKPRVSLSARWARLGFLGSGIGLPRGLGRHRAPLRGLVQVSGGETCCSQRRAVSSRRLDWARRGPPQGRRSSVGSVGASGRPWPVFRGYSRR